MLCGRSEVCAGTRHDGCDLSSGSLQRQHLTSVFLKHVFSMTPTFSTVAMNSWERVTHCGPAYSRCSRLLRHLLETVFRHSVQNRTLSSRGCSPLAPRALDIVLCKPACCTSPGTAAAASVLQQQDMPDEAGSSQLLLFPSSIGKHDLPRYGSLYHRTCLDCLIQLVRDNSLQIVRHLPSVVEAVIRPLYPGEPVLRKCASLAALCPA